MYAPLSIKITCNLHLYQKHFWKIGRRKNRSWTVILKEKRSRKILDAFKFQTVNFQTLWFRTKICQNIKMSKKYHYQLFKYLKRPLSCKITGNWQNHIYEWPLVAKNETIQSFKDLLSIEWYTLMMQITAGDQWKPVRKWIHRWFKIKIKKTPLKMERCKKYW